MMYLACLALGIALMAAAVAKYDRDSKGEGPKR